MTSTNTLLVRAFDKLADILRKQLLAAIEARKAAEPKTFRLLA